MADGYQMALANYQQAQQQGAATQAPQGGPQPQGGAKSLFMLGDGSSVDDLYVAQLAAQHLGMPVSGVSPDGSALMLQNGQSVPIMAALQQMGAQVQGFKPMNADYSQAQPQLRAAMATLPDDFRRKQYLQHHMQQLGMPNPMVEGNGDDWFVFDPTGGKWMAATNTPGADLTDAADAMISGTKMLGAIGGGVLGAGAGPVGIIGGSAAGGAGVNALQKAAFEMFDPTYNEIRGQMSEGEILADIGKGAAVDAAGAALPIAGGAVLGRMMGKGGQVAAAPLSRMASGTGAAAENVGAAVKNTAGLFDKQWFGKPGSVTQGIHGHDVAAGAMPVSAPLQAVGLGAQLPSMAVRGANTAAQWAGGGVPGSPGARSILSEFGGGAGRAIGRRMQPPKVGSEELAPYLRDAEIYRGSDLVELGSPEFLAQELWRDQAAANLGGRGRAIGSSIGNVLENVEKVGVGAEELARRIGGAGVKAARYGGAGLETAGRGARAVGQAGRNYRGVSLEDQIYGQLGAEEAYSRLPRASLNPYEALLKERQSYLAGGY